MIKKAKEKEYAGDAGAGCACRYGYTKPDDYPSCMYDEETGLPSFNLFEDRLKMALINERVKDCLLYTSPSPRDYAASRMPSSA